ncbi:unnamed protein product [Lota lota]
MIGRGPITARHKRPTVLVLQMWCYSVLVFVGVAIGWSVQVSCSITCPDGKECSDDDTCCRTTDGYSCCPYPKAVCCSDLAHCCPKDYICDSTTQMCTRKGHPLLSVPMRQKVFHERQGSSLSTLPLSRLQGPRAVLGQGGAGGQGGLLVDCGEEDDGSCPSGTECCRQPGGGWLCCPVSADLRYPLSPRGSPVHLAPKTSSPGNRIIRLRENTMEGSDGMGGMHCDAVSYCPSGTSCCQGTTDNWSCCPYPLGHCCSDGVHCCEYGYTCDPSNLRCRKGFTDVPSGTKKDVKRY